METERLTSGFPSTEQHGIVVLPATARALVVADAGTGKTETLIARIGHLIEAEGLSPGAELLVLSFSRAAVGEIKRRAAARSDEVGYVRVTTFDSYATSLLAAHPTDAVWTDVGYDGRIEAATGLLESDDAAATVESIRHVLVDEIQDLVGVRLAFTKRLLEKTDAGFTLLGDPAQAIYDWQESEESVERPDLIEWLRSRFSHNGLSEHRLTANHRARTETAGSALDVGRALNNPGPDYESIGRRLNSLTGDLVSLGSPETAQVALKRMRGTAAVLCRNNGQALSISALLRDLGVPHSLRRRATDRAVAPWVGRVFAALDAGPASPAFLTERIQGLTALNPPTSNDPLRLLKRMSPGRGPSIEARTVSARIATGYVPDELTATSADNLAVSTVHRAKGLEFDQVVVLEPTRMLDADPDKLPGEVHLRYVALTRARDAIYTMEEPPYDHLRLDKRLGRWVRTGWKQWHRSGIELRPRDIEYHRPAAFTAAEALDIQDYLWNKVRPGDAVVLTLDTYSPVGLPRAHYRVEHGGRPIGRTSEEFSQALYTFLEVNPSWEVHWPRAIEGAYIDAVDTVAGTSAAAANAGLGTSGIWLRGRIGGMGIFMFDGRKTGSDT